MSAEREVDDFGNVWDIPNANLRVLPVWKKGATAEDWFYDLAIQARKYPECYEKMVLVYAEARPNDGLKVSYFQHGMSTIELLGLVEAGKQEILDYTRR